MVDLALPWTLVLALRSSSAELALRQERSHAR